MNKKIHDFYRLPRKISIKILSKFSSVIVKRFGNFTVLL